MQTWWSDNVSALAFDFDGSGKRSSAGAILDREARMLEKTMQAAAASARTRPASKFVVPHAPENPFAVVAWAVVVEVKNDQATHLTRSDPDVCIRPAVPPAADGALVSCGILQPVLGPGMLPR